MNNPGYGESLRSWIALLSLKETPGDSPVEVIHTAGRMYPMGEDAGGAAREETDICFSVPWACVWTNPTDPADRVAILGRTHDGWLPPAYLPNTPLAVDLKTKKVTKLGERLPQFDGIREGAAAVCVNGSLVVVGQHATTAWFREPDGDYRVIPITDQPTQGYYLLQAGSRIISPGRKWLSITVESDLKVDTLAEQMIPDFLAMDRYCVSATCGIWAATEDESVCYRTTADKPCRRSVSPFFEYVPADKLEQHERAAAAIRGLGGFADRIWRCKRDHLSGAEPYSRKDGTVVCLTADWTGGDDGLQHLKDLYSLRGLYVFGAPITDDGMRQVGELRNLQVVVLVDTKATSEGVGCLRNLYGLYGLCLDAGRSNHKLFGDSLAELLQTSRGPNTLVLCGPEFTDEVLPVLDTTRRIKALHLVGTSVSEQLCRELPRCQEGDLKISFDLPPQN